MPEKKTKPWYAGERQDVFFYLLIAVFFLEMAVGGVAFFHGIMHARPETPGGPPMAQFPWFGWALAAVFAPIALLLIVHLTGMWISAALTRDEKMAEGAPGDSERVPEGMKRFYASVRQAPTVVLLAALLFCGAALFFVDGALAYLASFGRALIPYIPWLAGSLAGLLAFCFLAHAILVYRQRKMEREYAWRREVLEKTGLVLMDRYSRALPQNKEQAALLAGTREDMPNVLDVVPKSIGQGQNEDNEEEKK